MRTRLIIATRSSHLTAVRMRTIRLHQPRGRKFFLPHSALVRMRTTGGPSSEPHSMAAFVGFALCCKEAYRKGHDACLTGVPKGSQQSSPSHVATVRFQYEGN